MDQLGRGVTLLALLAATACSQTSSHTFERLTAPVIALTHVRVIDGTGRPARDDQTLVIQDGRIAALGQSGAVRDSARRPHAGSDRKDGAARSGRHARAPLLSNRASGIDAARHDRTGSIRQAVPGSRRHDDPHGGDGGFRRRPAHQTADRNRCAAGTGNRRHGAVPERGRRSPEPGGDRAGSRAARPTRARRRSRRTRPFGPRS